MLLPDGLALSETAERTQGPSKVPWNLSFCPLPFCVWPWAWKFWEGRAEEASVWGRSWSGITAEGGNHWVYQAHLPVHDFHPHYRVRLKILTSICDMEEGKKISAKHDLGGEASKRWRWVPTISYSDQEPCSSVVETLLGACVCVCMCTRVCMYVHACVHVWARVCVHACVCACTCVHVWGVCMYIHVCLCMCVGAYLCERICGAYECKSSWFELFHFWDSSLGLSEATGLVCFNLLCWRWTQVWLISLLGKVLRSSLVILNPGCYQNPGAYKRPCMSQAPRPHL